MQKRKKNISFRIETLQQVFPIFYDGPLNAALLDSARCHSCQRNGSSSQGKSESQRPAVSSSRPPSSLPSNTRLWTERQPGRFSRGS